MLGSTLGAYRLDETLGSGGMGTVFRATAVTPSRAVAAGDVVALKLLHPELMQREGAFKRFLREADIGRSIVHVNVVRTLDVDAIAVEGATAHFLVLELVDGQTLRELLDEVGTVSEALCRMLAIGIAGGLSALHDAGVIHRDVKPSNVLVTSEHEVKLMDLGVARAIDPSTDISLTGAFVGSLRYAAPEQFGRGTEQMDGRLDLHALGVMLYELATGRHPFRDGDFHQIVHSVLHDEPPRIGAVNPQLSPFFEEVVHRLLAKAPDDRFPSAHELVRVLEAGEGGTWWTERATSLRTDSRRPLRRIRIPRETTLHGREPELARLRALYDQSVAGEGQVLLLRGEAGIGKTRLVDELVARLSDDGCDVNFLFGTYPPGGAATDAGAFSTAFREQLGSEDLERTLATYLGDTPTLVPAFAGLLRGEVAPAGSPHLTKESIQTVFATTAHRLAAERPTIILIDDLHFAPAEGRALFSSLALSIARHPVLLIGTSRTGDSDDWFTALDRAESVSQMHIERLGAKDLSGLLVEAFGSERLAATLALQIAEHSDGNPFFVFEILRNLRETQRIQRRDDGSWATTSVLERIELPDSLSDLVHARLKELCDEDRDMLEVAACAGFEFDPLLVARALGSPEIPLLKRLSRLEHDLRIVRAVGRRCVFDHSRVRGVLYDGLSELLRERYHALLGAAMEESGAAVRAGDAVAICEHFLKGAAGGRALPHLDEALAHLESGHLNDAAAELALGVLRAPDTVVGEPRVRLQLRAARWLQLASSREQEGAVLDDALAAARELSDESLVVDVLVAIGEHLELFEDHEGAVRTMTEALELARRNELHSHASRALRFIGHAEKARGRLDAARASYEEARDIARAAGAEAEEASAIGGLGMLLNRLGDRRGAIAAFEVDLEICRRLGRRAAEGKALGSLGLVYDNLGEMDKARDAYAASGAIAREVGDRRSLFIAQYNLAAMELRDGRLRAARDLFEEGLVLANEIGYREGAAAATGSVATCYVALGRLGDALRAARENLRMSAAIGRAGSIAISHLNLVSLYGRLGAYDEARTSSEAALTTARRADQPRILSFALFNAARLHDILGDDESALARLSECLELRRAIQQRVDLPSTLTMMGEFLAKAGREDEARVALEEALRIADEIDSEPDRAAARAQLAVLDGQAPPDVATDAPTDGDQPGAERDPDEHVPGGLEAGYRLWKATGDERSLRNAHRCLMTLAAHVPPEYATSILENVAANAEIVAAMAAFGDGGGSPQSGRDR